MMKKSTIGLILSVITVVLLIAGCATERESRAIERARGIGEAMKMSISKVDCNDGEIWIKNIGDSKIEAGEISVSTSAGSKKNDKPISPNETIKIEFNESLSGEVEASGISERGIEYIPTRFCGG